MADSPDTTNPTPYPHINSGDLNLDDLYALVRRAEIVALAIKGLREDSKGHELHERYFEALMEASENLVIDLQGFAGLRDERDYYKALDDRVYEFRCSAIDADREAAGLTNVNREIEAAEAEPADLENGKALIDDLNALGFSPELRLLHPDGRGISLAYIETRPDPNPSALDLVKDWRSARDIKAYLIARTANGHGAAA